MSSVTTLLLDSLGVLPERKKNIFKNICKKERIVYYFKLLTRESTFEPQEDEKGTKQKCPKAEINKANVQHLKRLNASIATKICCHRYRQKVVKQFYGLVVSVVSHDL